MDKDQARQLNAKIQLDSKIRKKAERLLRQMARDFEKLYAEKGVYLDFNVYAEKWQDFWQGIIKMSKMSLLEWHLKSLMCQ